MDIGVKKWYESQTIWGGIIQFLVFLDLVLDLKIGTETINSFVLGVAGLIGVIMVIYGRVKAKYVIK